MQVLLALVKLVLNQAYTNARFPAPAVSEYCSAKLWLAPDPELGVTEAVVAFVVMNDQTGELLLPPAMFATTIQ